MSVGLASAATLTAKVPAPHGAGQPGDRLSSSVWVPAGRPVGGARPGYQPTQIRKPRPTDSTTTIAGVPIFKVRDALRRSAAGQIGHIST